MKILVTAGPTREPLDPVRFLSNPSTGKMGYAIARAARARGHRVALVSGPTALKPPAGVETVKVVTAEEMLRAVRRRFGWCDGVVMAAAVGDFRAAKPSSQKLKKGKAGGMTLKLVRTPDILETLARRKGKKWLVGFAAETEDLEKNAARKLAKKKLDMVVGNLVGRCGSGFGADTNAATVLTADGKRYRLSKRTKSNLARWILEKIERDLQRR